MQVSVLAGVAAALLALVCPEVDCGTPVVCWHGINDNAARWKCPDMSSYPVSSKHLVSSIQTYHSCLVALGPWTGWRRRPPTPTPGPSWSGMTWTTTPPTVSSWAPTTRSGICGGGLALIISWTFLDVVQNHSLISSSTRTLFVNLYEYLTCWRLEWVQKEIRNAAIILIFKSSYHNRGNSFNALLIL